MDQQEPQNWPVSNLKQSLPEVPSHAMVKASYTAYGRFPQ